MWSSPWERNSSAHVDDFSLECKCKRLFCSEKDWMKEQKKNARKWTRRKTPENIFQVFLFFLLPTKTPNKHGRRLKLIFLYSHCELALKLLAVSKSDRCWARESHSSRNTQRKRIEVHWVFSVLFLRWYLHSLASAASHTLDVVWALCESYWKISKCYSRLLDVVCLSCLPLFPLFTCIAFSHTRLRWQVGWEETMSTV